MPDYPIRLDISRQGPARRAPPARRFDPMQAVSNAMSGLHSIPMVGTAARFLPPLVMSAMRQSSGGEMPPTPPKPTPAPAATAARRDSIATPFLEAVRELFPGMDKVSLGQLASLSGSFNNMIPASAKPPTSAKDAIGMELLGAARTDFAQKVAEAQANPDTQARVDGQRSAYNEYIQRLAMFNGAGLMVPGLEPEND